MKQLNEYLNRESTGSSFKHEVKYSKADWEKWKKEIKKDVSSLLCGSYHDKPELELVYIPDHKNKVMDHIATYNKKTEQLFCDDIKIFGHEV